MLLVHCKASSKRCAARIDPSQARAGAAPLKAHSELTGEAVCDQEYACGLEQRMDDGGEPVVAQREALVLWPVFGAPPGAISVFQPHVDNAGFAADSRCPHARRACLKPGSSS